MSLNVFGEIFFSLTKIGLLFFLFLYIIFAFLVSKQVRLMTKTLEVGFESVLTAVAVLHLIVAVVVFAYAFFVL